MSNVTQDVEQKRIFAALPDPADFRDKLFEPSLVEVPSQIKVEDYLKYEVPVLDQGNEGACTGFGLATVANYLLRQRRIEPDTTVVSPRMFYEMARRYDIWPGEGYEGSSARGAMKSWHKHGVCSEQMWPYIPGVANKGSLTLERTDDAVTRPLGAYYRVNHKDLVAMHSALAEVGILYATAVVHSGWHDTTNKGIIEPTSDQLGGHAFAIIAYNRDGFWIQNSWGIDWGNDGIALLTYDDWLDNSLDVWVARLGVPIRLNTAEATATTIWEMAGKSDTVAIYKTRQHLISVGNDGRLREKGTYGTSKNDVERIFEVDFLKVTESWKKKRILLYAHGGLVDEKSAVQRIADYRSTLLKHEIYPLAFNWKTDYWTTWKNILQDAIGRHRAAGPLDGTRDFILDRLDDTLEPLVRVLSGKTQWDEMKENGILATQNERGAGRIALHYLSKLLHDNPDIELHVASHSAGSIFMAPIIQLLTALDKIASGPMKGKNGHGLQVKSCTLWAPAITMKLFKETYWPAIQGGQIEQCALYTLSDQAEQDDHCANIYHKSLLYLVSNALEEKTRIPLIQPDGTPLLGMSKFVDRDEELKTLFSSSRATWILAPNHAGLSSLEATSSQRHGDFDDDPDTIRSTVARILDAEIPVAGMNFPPSAKKLQEQRSLLPE